MWGGSQNIWGRGKNIIKIYLNNEKNEIRIIQCATVVILNRFSDVSRFFGNVILMNCYNYVSIIIKELYWMLTLCHILLLGDMIFEDFHQSPYNGHTRCDLLWHLYNFLFTVINNNVKLTLPAYTHLVTVFIMVPAQE